MVRYFSLNRLYGDKDRSEHEISEYMDQQLLDGAKMNDATYAMMMTQKYTIPM